MWLKAPDRDTALFSHQEKGEGLYSATPMETAGGGSCQEHAGCQVTEGQVEEQARLGPSLHRPLPPCPAPPPPPPSPTALLYTFTPVAIGVP